MKIYLSLFALINCLNSLSQSIHQTENFNVGYRNIFLTDSSRNYKLGVSTTNKLYFRPVEIDVWYPAAKPVSGNCLLYGAFLNLLEERSNRFQDDSIYTKITSDLVQYCCANLKISDSTKLTKFVTSGYENAKPATGKFPLIIYMCSFNGMSFENIQLFEMLAQQGFIVASITSVGLYPGNMSTKISDLMEQVKDGEFALNFLKKHADIDSANIGTLGYSWGGFSSMILTKNNSSIKSILSFDGSEMHSYGESADEDWDFDTARQSPFFKSNKICVPYAYLESGHKHQDSEIDSIFNPLFAYAPNHRYIHFINAMHEDFSGLPALAATINGSQTPAVALNTYINLFALNYFKQTLKGENGLLPNQTTELFKKNVTDSIYYTVSFKNRLSIRGRVTDEKNHEGISYVNIGVPEKNRGTVSQADGNFTFKIDSTQTGDSVLFSIVGYDSKMIAVSNLLKQKRPLVISLQQRITQMNEVVVSSKLMPLEIKGNTTKSGVVSIGLPLKFMGSETGIKINLGKHPVFIKNFSFNINENRLDTAVFRMNIYNIKKGKPFQNILAQNILVKIGNQKGKFALNLSDYNLVMQGEILLSLEWIEGAVARKNNGAIFLSAGFLNSSTWHRLTSQSSWKKATGLGVGFNLEVQKLPAHTGTNMNISKFLTN